MLLLDASVWLASVDPRDRFHSSAATTVSSATLRPLAALDLTLYEVANVAVTGWRDPDRADGIVELVLTAVDRLARVDAALIADAVALARNESLTVYDAAYVACARQAGWVLVSADVRDLVGPGYAVAPDAIPAISD